jgi:hypothetical protein
MILQSGMKITCSIVAFGLMAIVSGFEIQGAPASGSQEPSNGNPSSSAVHGTPKIQFEKTFVDFGKTTGGEKLSGVFKFTNTGDGILKVEPPVPSCDCTDSKVKPGEVAPGESGEILYTIKLDRAVKGQRFIRVSSNDPKNSVVTLTMQLDHTPLYDTSPKVVRVMVPAAKDEGEGTFTVTRIDGQPLGIDRVTTSQKWMTAAFDPALDAKQSSARVKVTVHRSSNPPALINATVSLWSGGDTNHPAQTVFITGEVEGELAAVPGRLYWVIPDFGKDKTKYPAEALTRKIEIVSVLGHEFEIKSVTNTVKGLSSQIVTKAAKKTFELVLSFDELPQAFVNGKIVVETSLPSLPKLEVPVTIAVPGSQ